MTREQAALASRLRLLDGASAQEAAIVLSTVTDLAAWEHELRGKGGKWTASPDAVAKDISKSLDIAMRQKKVASLADIQAEHSKHVADINKVTEAHAKAMNALVTDLKKKSEAVQREERVKQRKVLAWHVGTLVAGAGLAFAEMKMGIDPTSAPNDAALVAGAVGPGVVTEIIDFFKKFA